MQLYDYNYIHNPLILTWETKEAKFFYIEFSPTHVLEIKIDKITTITEKTL